MRLPRFLLVFVFLFQVHMVDGLLAQDADLQKRINQAIDKGLAHLRKTQNKDGAWANPQADLSYMRSGITALVGWTMLECGVDPTDQQIQKAADHLRSAALDMEYTYTYTISLMILFFDKLGDPADEILIEALAVRLMRGITRYGGWAYDCGSISFEEAKQLKRAAQELRDNPPKRDPKAARKLHPLIVDQLKALKPASAGMGDNSNTQFAALALWVARRHGLPVDQHLRLVSQRFQASVEPQGGWAYQPFRDKFPPETKPVAPYPTPAMTCAGLLAYALGEGAKAKGKTNKELLEEPVVQDAVKLLADCFGSYPGGAKMGQAGLNYLLFSVERMAVIYDLKTIGDIDWYVWGASRLVEDQVKEKRLLALEGKSFVHADTCFALLFLKRANVAPDLTAGLKGIVKAPLKKESTKAIPKDLFDLPILIPKSEKPAKEKPPSPQQSRRSLPSAMATLTAAVPAQRSEPLSAGLTHV